MSGSLRLGLFFSKSWKSRVPVGWFACLRHEAAACRKPGIVRLTSDIGLRPNARCPARGVCVTVEVVAAGEHPKETLGPGEADFSCTTHAAQNARLTRELVQGCFPF